MEAICSTETSDETQRTARGHIPEDYTLKFYGRLNNRQLLQELSVLDRSSRQCECLGRTNGV
jgi:hypothetical protein